MRTSASEAVASLVCRSGFARCWRPTKRPMDTESRVSNESRHKTAGRVRERERRAPSLGGPDVDQAHTHCGGQPHTRTRWLAEHAAARVFPLAARPSSLPLARSGRPMGRFLEKSVAEFGASQPQWRSLRGRRVSSLAAGSRGVHV